MPLSRIKLKRDLCKVEGKTEANKRRWTAPKTTCGVTPPAAAQNDDDVTSARHNDDHAGFKGTLPPGVSDVSNSDDVRRSKTWKRLHKKQICYRVRLCLSERNPRRPKNAPHLDSHVSVEADILGKPRRGRGRPRKGENSSASQTIRTEVRVKSSCTLSGRAPNVSKKVGLRRCLRSGSRKELKRLVKNACCALCGDVKYGPDPNKSPAREPRAGRSGPTARRKSAGGVAKPLRPPAGPALRFERYPAVTLCDVARVFAITARDFSCVLPEALTRTRGRERVWCLKKEFRFHPHLCGDKKHRSGIDDRAWEVSTPTHSCASFSSGDPPSGATSCVSTPEIRDGCVWDYNGYGKRGQADVDRVANGGRCVIEGDGEKASRVMNRPGRCHGVPGMERRVPPIILRRVNTVNSFRCDNRCLSQDEGEEDNKLNNVSEAELNLPERSSCRRTEAYVFFYQSSCARICKPWPFPRSGPPDELRSLLRSGRRWIEATPTATETDVQDKLCKSTGVKEAHVNSSPSVDGLESNGSVRRDFEDSSCVPEISEKKHVDSDELTPVLNSKGRCLNSYFFALNAPDRKAVSAAAETQLDIPVIRTEDATFPCISNSKCTRIYPVRPTPSVPGVENQKEPGIHVDALTFYNPESLSELCLKVETLKAQCPSTAERSTQKLVKLTLASNAGKRKRSGLSKSTVTDSSSSEDKFEYDSYASSDEDPLEHDETKSLWSNDESEDKGITPSQPLEDSTVPNGFLDVCRAYEEDVLILDVIQDDPDLFGAIGETINKPGMSEEGDGEAQTKRQSGNHCRIVFDLNTDRSKPASALNAKQVEDGDLRKVNEIQSYKNPCQVLQIPSALKSETAVDLNNNQEIKDANNVYRIKVMNKRLKRLVMDTSNIGQECCSTKDSSSSRTSNNYCWYYFDEYNYCNRNCCRFLHTPRDGDETFCMERIQKFCCVGNPITVMRAVELFIQYYSKCSPGVCFSQEIVNSLLSSLLVLGMLRKFVDIVNLLLKHKSLPSREIVVAAFKHVRDRGLIDCVSDLILLTSKIVVAGCVFSVDQCEVMQSHLQMMQVPRQQMDIFLAVKCRALATNPHTAELSDLAQAVVRVEMLKHQEDWSRLAHVFCGVCTGPHSTSDLNRFYCCVTMALLKETKDKLTLPYELFAESVLQRIPSDDMVKIVLGRIGVSLILRYHRTREWNKGVKLVNVMFGLQIHFTTLKGLMGNEYMVSRCQLVTSATELFLHSGSIEGALKMLRADNWFVNSNVWPCDPADIICRKRVLTLLAGRTSHRDTFDILANLPGLRQAINGLQVDEYTDMFNAHLRLCMMKQTLPVAADILEFMLAKGILPETLQLQNLIHKLGKQNNWSRARALFNRARSTGYYSTVVYEQDSLFLPCSLTEIEMTLAFEMFITSLKTNLQTPTESSQPLIITLRRQGDVEDVTESMYLAAGCRLLSAALIPNPKLGIRYTAVSQKQEQLFVLDRGSAHKWLSQNEQWALEMWGP